MRSNRIPLQKGTMLTEQIKIIDLLSGEGGTSLTYRAHDIVENRYIVVKEAFPFECEGARFFRDKNGFAVRVETAPGDGCRVDVDKIVLDLEQRFKQECETAVKISEEKGSNSIRFFPCFSITDSVKLDKRFSGTVSQYNVFNTIYGETLEKFVESRVNLKDSLLYCKKILETLAVLHEEKGLLNLDLKLSNIYFSEELSIENKYAIFIDCGSFQRIKELDFQYGASNSVNFSAPELQLYCYNKQQGFIEEALSWKKQIGVQTDLFSVGAIFLHLVRGNLQCECERKDDWECIFHYSTPQKIRRRIVHSILNEVIESKDDYIIDELTSCIVCALHFDLFATPKIERFESAKQFLKVVNKLINDINNEGISPEIILRNSIERQYKTNLSYYGIYDSDAPHDTIPSLIPEMLPEVKVISKEKRRE